MNTRTITPEAFYSLIGQSRAGLYLLDVRESAEYLAEHIPRTENAPLSKIFLWKSEIVPRDYVYLYSQTEKRALTAFHQIFPEICAQVWILEGGLEAWKGRKFPLEEGNETEKVEDSLKKR